jgi:hypothetical protein
MPVSGGAASPSLLDQLMDGWFDMAKWLVKHVGPMNYLLETGVRLADSAKRWKVNGSIALAGAFLLPAVALGATPVWPAVGSVAVAVAGGNAALLVLALGAVLGYFAIPAFGVALAMSIQLLALAIVLGALALVAVLGFRALDAWLSEPSPTTAVSVVGRVTASPPSDALVALMEPRNRP